MKEIIIPIITIAAFVIINSCNLPTEPPDTHLTPYMTLCIGDIRQYYIKEENIYIQAEIIGDTLRKDGLKVYIIEFKYLLPDGVYKGKDYYFIKDGYFWQTNLDTVISPSINKINPFLEIKLMKIYPKNGDYFLSTDGVLETKKVYHKIMIIDSLKTFVKTFYNVAECQIIDTNTVMQRWVYYAPKFGHIGTLLSNQNGTAGVYLTYIKVEEGQIGKFFSFPTRRTIENFSQSKFHTIPSLFR
jgi:hypothetical protein